MGPVVPREEPTTLCEIGAEIDRIWAEIKREYAKGALGKDLRSRHERIAELREREQTILASQRHRPASAMEGDPYGHR